MRSLQLAVAVVQWHVGHGLGCVGCWGWRVGWAHVRVVWLGGLSSLHAAPSCVNALAC
jgi:hypothetical protein